MVLRIRAIKAQEFAVGDNRSEIERLVAQQLGANGVAGDLIRTMADYPEQLPTKRPYKRKGSGGLGGGWRMKQLARHGRTIFSETENRVTYAGRVQGLLKGPKGPNVQTREMKRRNWLSIEDGVRRVWPKHERVLIRILTQRDRRVRRRPFR